MYSNLINFSFDEISEWLNDYWLFLIKPKITIDRLLSKPKEKVFRQFLFHFIVYTSAYIFLSLGTTITDWIKPAIINLFFSIPIIFILAISAKIATGNSYYRKIIMFVSGSVLIFVPITIVMYAAFLQSENYTYKFMTDIFSGLIALYVVLVVGFAIEGNIIKASKISFVSYLVVNLLFFSFERINNDPYSSDNFDEYDPIFQEYAELTKPLKNKEVVPTTRFISVFKNKIETHFGTQDIIKGKVSQSNDFLEKQYLKDLNDNITHVTESSTQIKFRRNKIIATYWQKYFHDIKEEVDYKVINQTQIDELKLEPIPFKTVQDLGGQIYLMNTDIKKIFETQLFLKAYNNSIIENHETSLNIIDTSQIILFFFGKLGDYLVGDVILKEGDPKPYKEIFKEIE
jgi:hypothetical protein